MNGHDGTLARVSRAGAGRKMPTEKRATLVDELRIAVATALGGDWEGAHEVAQRHEDDSAACWLHAVCHRMEGDLDNARYWYRRCGKELRAQLSTEAELQEIAKALGP
jgi:hypothetical protein